MTNLKDFFLDEGYKEVYLKNLDEIKGKLKSVIQLNTPLFNFTDHGINHSDEINIRLSKLFFNLFSHSDTKIRLNNAELYSLISAVYLHDIGMDLIKKEEIIKMFTRKDYKNPFQKYLADSIDIKEIEKFGDNSPELYDFIRKKHHVISSMWIMSNRHYEGTSLHLPFINSFVQSIALIVFSHNESIDVFNNAFYKNTQVNNENIQIKLLSYLLRVGDSLHTDRSRCLIDVLELKDIPVDSKIHWFRHYYTKSISIENQNIDILFEFPDDPEWSDDVENYLICDTKHWIIQNFEDLTLKRLFEDSYRNSYLKCILSDSKEYLDSIKPIDKKVKQKILELIGNKANQIIVQEKEKYIRVYEQKFSEQLIHNKYDDSITRGLLEIFVEPRLYEFSEYKKGDKKNEKKKKYDIKSLMVDEYSYLISGRQGIGKTTLLRYMFLISKDNKIPFILDFADIKYDTNKMVYKKIKEISENGSLNINIDVALQNKNCLIFIDNVDKSSTYFNNIVEFCKCYPNNKVIMTQLESDEEEICSLTDSIKDKETTESIKELFIHYLGINELRVMVNKWFVNSDRDSYSVFSSIYEYILDNNLPRTPLLYSLFLSIIEKESAFLPTNVASLFDKFADIYLGKYSNLFPNYSSKNDYNRKKYVLKELAHYMVDNNKKKLHIDEYYKLINNLFGGFGIKINPNDLLLDLQFSNLFTREGDYVKFSFDCFLFFFYAKKIAETDKSSDVLFENARLQKFSNIIVFYSGLLMNCKDLLEECSLHLIDMGKIDNDIINNKINSIFSYNKNSLFSSGDIKSMDESEIEESINTQKEHEEFIENSSQTIPEKKLTEQEHNFITMLLQVCNMLKNSEYIDSKLKKEVLELCIDCYTLVLCELINDFEKIIISENDKEKQTEDFKNNIITLFTLVTESIAHSTLGTSMLEEQLKELMNSPKNILCDFIYCMLSAELDLDGYVQCVESFIEKTNNYLLLDCLILKLEMIFDERNFFNKPNEKKKMLNLIRLALEKILKERDKSSRYKEQANYYVSNVRRRKLAYEHKYMPFLITEQ